MDAWTLSNWVIEIYTIVGVPRLVSLLELSMAPLTAFVAIGIPVSFGVLKNYADRHRAPYLIRHINQIGPISAQNILVVSAAYLIGSVSLLVISPVGDVSYLAESNWKCAAIIALSVYLALIVSTTIWYRHLYRILSRTPSQMVESIMKKSNAVDPIDQGWM